MLFNSNIFLFLFLPIVFLGFFQLGKYNRSLGALWLFASSLFFYGWWNPAYVLLLLFSIVFNYGIGVFLSMEHDHGHVVRAGWILRIGIVANLMYSWVFQVREFLC